MVTSAAVRVLTLVGDRGVLREDRDALFTLEVVRVHRAFIDMRVLAERARLTEHGVDERGLAVVDVRDDCDIAEVRTEGVRHADFLKGIGM